ncbi:MAG: TIGR02266 family protein, partial [Polyangiales bacterium]
MTEMRKDRRAPASLKVKYKSATVDEFIEQFGADVSRGGIFIKTRKPLDVGALLKFEFQLHDGEPVIHGVGRVAWRRSEEQGRPDLPIGMGIKFIKLDEQSRTVIDRIETRHGPGSRYEQTEAAEVAPTLSSSLPPSAFATAAPAAPAPTSVPPGARPTPLVPAPITPASEWPTATHSLVGLANATAQVGAAAGGGRSAGPALAQPTSSHANAAATFRPPPASVSSLPPALGESVVSHYPRPPSAPASGGPAVKGSPVPKGALGVTGSRRPAPATRSAARDTSEFLATAFSVGGAGQEVRSQARAQVERARNDPHSVDLASELFGDLSEPSAGGARREATLDADHVLRDLHSVSTKPPSAEERLLADKIPSLDELENEPSHTSGTPFVRQVSDHVASPESALAAETVRPVPSSPDGQLSFGTAGTHRDRESPDRPDRLSLELPQISDRPRASSPSNRPPVGQARSKVLPIVLGALFVLVAVGVFVMMRSSVAAPAPARETAPEAQAATPAAAPVPPPPPPPAAAAASPIELALSSTPHGAEALVNGQRIGATPTKLSLQTGTTVELSLSLAGYATKTERLAVTQALAGKPYEVALTPLPYELKVISEPEGATLSVGQATAVSPAPLALGHIDGPVTLTVELAGYRKLTRVVRLDEFQDQSGTLRAEL